MIYHKSGNNFIKIVKDINLIDFFDYNLYYTCNDSYNPIYLNNDRLLLNEIHDKIISFKKINSDKIEFYEIDNIENKKNKEMEENFEELVNNLDISNYII